MSVYVFGIGGTGSRILRALTLLLASGANTGNHDVVPISIDVDNTNRDTERSIDSIIAYINFKNSIQNSIFSYKPKIRTIKNDDMNDINSINRSQFQLTLSDNLRGDFATYLGYNQLEAIDKEFLKSLYSESANESYTDKKGATITINKELYLNLNDGFKGRPNIGCIAFNELANKQNFVDIINEIASNPSNKIIVIGSIFGGTGSSGLPQIIQILDNYKNNPQSKSANGNNISNEIDNTPLCAINVYPYYNVLNNTNGVSEIVSTKFMAKSKNALNYYMGFTRTDRFYHIYDRPNHSFEYFVGGGTQRNDALWTEIIGAYAVLQFANDGTRISETQTTQHYGYSSFFPDNSPLTNLESGEIKLSNFHQSSKDDIIYPLIKMGITWYVTNRFLTRNDLSTIPFYANLQIGNNINFLNELNRELEWFKSYFDEMNRTTRSLGLFNFEANTLSNFLIINGNIDINTDNIYENRSTLYEKIDNVTDKKQQIYNLAENLATFYFIRLKNERLI